MEAPLCRSCGALLTNPHAQVCRFCGAALVGAYRGGNPFGHMPHHPPQHSPLAPFGAPRYPAYGYAQRQQSSTNTLILVLVVGGFVFMTVLGACVSALAS
jgi:hypothetical protein